MSSNNTLTYRDPKGRRQKPQKIINHIFYEMYELEHDPYWKSEFFKACHGRFPQKVTFKNGIVYFTKSNKREKLHLPEDIADAIENYKGFIHKNTWCRSRSEFEEDNKMNDDRISKNKSIQDYQWKELKKKKTKEILIMNYINYIAEDYEMTLQQKYELSMEINIGIITGTINSASIDYEDGIIKQIRGLEHNPETGKIILNETHRVKIKKPKTQKSVDLMDKWSTNNIITYDKMWKSYFDKYGTSNQSEYEVTESKSSISSEDF